MRLRRRTVDTHTNDYVMIGKLVYEADMGRLLPEATAFAYPSTWEGVGNSTAEAVRAGVPPRITRYPLGHRLHVHGVAVVARGCLDQCTHAVRSTSSSKGRIRPPSPVDE